MTRSGLETTRALATRTALDRLAIWAGLLGSSVIALGSVGTAVAYTAAVFNVALNIGGVCFVVFMLGLGATRRGRLRYAYGATRVVAASAARSSASSR